MSKPSKRFTALVEKVQDRLHTPTEAIELVKANATAKFDETVEA
ncbi:MAG: 50S ribosomal protein L1, partial [Cyanobacteriota bacterium]